jgi:selenocysteine lyase/cysteine desulfurase
MSATTPPVVTLDQVIKPIPLFKERPPRFGHAFLDYFSFEKGYLNLNNGSYGALPKVVTQACNELMAWQEQNTDYYYRIGFVQPLIDVRAELAKFVGASNVDEVVIVGNTSSGISTVLLNFLWETGDTIIRFNTTYSTVSKNIQYIKDWRAPGVQLSEFELVFPTTRQAILDGWKKHVENVKKNAPAGKRIVAAIDAIIADPAVALPWIEMVKICKDAGVWTVIDGAHAVGQEPLELASCGADFFVSNCHKWLNTKRGCAFLWMPKRSQEIIKTTFPTSQFYGGQPASEALIKQFQYSGTIDYTPHFSLHVALQWRKWVGGEAAIQKYCNDLARDGGKVLARTMGTQVMDESGEFTKAMTNVRLPFSKDFVDKNDDSSPVGSQLNNRLLVRNMFAPCFYHNKNWWVRVSAQIWNELDDFQVLGEALISICSELDPQATVATIPKETYIDLTGFSSLPSERETGPPPTRDADNSTPVFFGRAYISGTVQPCKILPVSGEPKCMVPFGGQEVEHKDRFELLVYNPNVMELVHSFDGKIPTERKPVGGGREKNGQLYHGLGNAREGFVGDYTRVPGKAAEHLRGCNVPFAGKEVEVRNCEMLCWKIAPN